MNVPELKMLLKEVPFVAPGVCRVARGISGCATGQGQKEVGECLIVQSPLGNTWEKPVPTVTFELAAHSKSMLSVSPGELIAYLPLGDVHLLNRHTEAAQFENWPATRI